MIGNLNPDQQGVYGKYLAATNSSGGAANIDDTTLVWGDDGSLTATEDDGDVFKFSADGTLISRTEGKKDNNKTEAPVMDFKGKDKDAVLAELKDKYSAAATGGDPYTMDNEQMKAFQQAMNDGLVAGLNKAGFSKSDILAMIAEVFPSIGINGTSKGGYTVPYGHDEDSKKLYEQFTEQIGKIGDTSPEIEQLKTNIAGLQNSILHNNNQLKLIGDRVEKLKKEIQELIDKAIDESEEIAEEQKDEAKRIVNEELNNYINSKGTMSFEDFQAKVAGRLDSLDSSGQAKMSSVVSKLFTAESKMGLLNNYLTSMNSLQNANNNLQTQINCKTEKMEKLQEELKANGCEGEDDNCQRTDPIGFTADGSRYDFFIDKDNNAKLSNEQEFLGAEKGWNEMEALDKDGNGKVDKKELENAGVKVLITDKDGNQTVKNVSEVFADQDTIDLNSYKEIGKEMSNGNALLGTFGLTFNGNEVKDGYNTLDTIDWLDNNYAFSDKDEGKGRFAKGETVTAEDNSNMFVSLVEQFKEDYKKLEAQLEKAWDSINIMRKDVLDGISDGMQNEAESEAQKIANELAEFAKEKEGAKQKD